MIGRISGTLIDKQPPQIVVDCHGVGYEIEAPMTTIWTLPELNEQVSLFTHLAVRDDAHQLFGFSSMRERALFRTLLKVNGVGTRMALVILSGMDADAFAECVQAGDTARLTALPGVGKKTAERLIVEMRDRVGVIGDTGGASVPAAPRPSDPVEDAISGLIALGYKPQEASRMVHTLDCEGKSSEDIIRDVLRNVVQR